jgi:signal transduction histidine kinase
MSVRNRLAVVLTLSTLVIVALVGLVAAALSIWRADDPVPTTQAGAARVADGITVVVVAEQGTQDAAAQARHDALGWMFVALGVSIVPAMAAGWIMSARVLGDVDKALAEVEAIEQERQRDLDEVVHELRTPLAVAGTNLELAADDPTLDADTGRLIDAARRAADRMRRTVDDLAAHGRLAVHRTGTLDLAAETRAVAAEQAGPARARSLHILTAGAVALEVPAADRAAVRTALGNLAANAVRLAPSGSAITISCGQHAGWAWAAVSDEGPGIPARLHELVFERGWRGRHDRDRGRSATPDQRGLGLTISRQLAEAHGGLLTIDSEEGGGSVFAIWLPVAPDATDDDVVDGDHLHPRVRPWRSLQPADPQPA